MPRFDPPGHLDDLDDAQKENWSAKVSAWFDSARAGDPGENDGPRAQFFNPLVNPPAEDAKVATIAWNAFPRQVRSSSLSEVQRWRRADASRDVQDEYCEWSVSRDPATGKIVRVTFTCEPPEYWSELALVNPEKVLALYRQFVSPQVQHEDLFVAGQYTPKNRYNSTTTNGAMHLIQQANTLTAEIWLAAAATIRRLRDAQEITDAQALIRCSLYGSEGRNSDPFIGEQVNALARQRADITLNNPVGLYFHEFNPVGWTTPDNEDPRTFWSYVRGSDGHFVRAHFEVPAGRGYTVGDIMIASRRIDFGGQVADFVTMKLEGLATRLGQSTVAPFAGCRIVLPGAVASAVPLAPEAIPASALGTRTLAALSDPGAARSPNLALAANARMETLLRRLPAVLRGEREEDDSEAAPAALIPYPKLPPEHFATRSVSGRIMAFASPDSTYAVTRKLIESARHSIVIGIYDFSASYMKEHLKKAMRRGASVSLMLDTNADDDPNLFAELSMLGANCVKAPSQSAGNPNRYFGNAHEKIIVVDGEIAMIQSGNWSENSIPFNEGDGVVVGSFEPGNRDMGVAVQSTELARLFSDLVARDMRLALGEPPDLPPAVVAEADGAAASEMFFEVAPSEMPERLFSSLTITPSAPIAITPLVTPENFHGAIRELLRSALRSIRIEQQYIRGGQPAVEELLSAIGEARAENPGLVVKIIVSPKYLFGDKKQKFEKAMRDFGFEFDENYRYLSLRHFVHCHNKLVVVDDEKVLVGSQNWSTTGLMSNRETSLLIEHAGLAAYFAEIFDSDWQSSEPAETPDEIIARSLEGLRNAGDFAAGGVVVSSTGDYRDT
ncbi:phospholipase D-like domain-containing protein [Mesorhizobium sp. M0848]|uniref:phospholipase D-like domain-containing protein n=1 Tax=Mesorhizobium sp. M0848 TaxID=2957012 RepID=UPI00333D1476